MPSSFVAITLVPVISVELLVGLLTCFFTFTLNYSSKLPGARVFYETGCWSSQGPSYLYLTLAVVTCSPVGGMDKVRGQQTKKQTKVAAFQSSCRAGNS